MDADGARKRAVLLTVCGPAIYQLIRDLLSPAIPTSKSFEELVALVKEHQEPTPSVIVQRFHFYSRLQQSDESISEFIAQLRKLAHDCNFGDTLQDMLRDRLVCGCRDKRLQYKLLADTRLTYEKAIQMAKSDETAERGTKDLAGGTTHKLYANPRRAQPPKTPQVPFQSHAQSQPCTRCGATHSPATCRFKSAMCNYCRKQGHIAKVCRKKARDQQQGTGYGDKAQTKTLNLEPELDSDAEPYPLFYSSTPRPRPLEITVLLNEVETQMEVDTGATLSVMSEGTYKSLWASNVRPQLNPTGVRLTTYTGEKIQVLGQISVHVIYHTQKHRLTLQIVPTDGPTLLGRDWLEKIQLDWHEIHRLHLPSEEKTKKVLDRYPTVFCGSLGEIADSPASLYIDPLQTPRFYKARQVPYSLKSKVEAELTRLQRTGVVSSVKFSEWAAPIVPVVKREGNIRICGDYKLTVNAVSKTDPYPLPRIEDIFASLAGGKTFTKLDLEHAYQQVPLTEDSRKYTTINTHKGLFQYNRLPFGVASAPGIFQRTVENLLQGIPDVCVYLDDILITGPTDDAHLETLDKVLKRLDEAGVRLKQSKCEFMLPSVEYLGHRISASGLQPTDSKVKALKEAPVPTNTTQLKSFLGLLNYYGKFVPNLSTVLAPLHRLLEKRAAWTWNTEQQQSFDRVKALLTSDTVLAHYDPAQTLILACDASPYGIGAVLSHTFNDGSERPVAYTSRSLGPAEKRYSQLDKEGLAIVFGVKRFHQYLAGRQFTILSDHKPLQHLFQETSGIPTLASARIQRWALVLSAYNYSIKYKPGAAHANADGLSRLPLPDLPPRETPPSEITQTLNLLLSLPITVKDIRAWTSTDPLLSKVRLMLESGWEKSSDNAYTPYNQRKDELSIEDGCVLWGTRVVIPPQGREKILSELHQGHPGISRMKSLARSFVWWPSIDKDLEAQVKHCEPCQRTRNLPATAPIQPWEFPKRPWSRIHIDYAGPFQGHMFLVIVDAYSKWLDVKVVKQATSTNTITALRSLFATHGIPELIISDNGTVFTSAEFQQFTKQNGIRHNTSAPYHPATNGLAERAVQTFKTFLKKSSDGSLEDRLALFLFRYRITPHSTTGATPAQLLMGRQLRSRLDLLRPSLGSRVKQQQERQKLYSDKSVPLRSFALNESVYVSDLPAKDSWLPGIITKEFGTRTFEIRLSDDRIVRRHIDHIRQRSITSPNNSTQSDWVVPEVTSLAQPTPPSVASAQAPPQVLPPRRSGRVVRQPDRLIDQYSSQE